MQQVQKKKKKRKRKKKMPQENQTIPMPTIPEQIPKAPDLPRQPVHPTPPVHPTLMRFRQLEVKSFRHSPADKWFC